MASSFIALEHESRLTVTRFCSVCLAMLIDFRNGYAQPATMGASFPQAQLIICYWWKSCGGEACIPSPGLCGHRFDLDLYEDFLIRENGLNVPDVPEAPCLMRLYSI